MKKVLIVVACFLVFTSCYNTRIIVGNINPKIPLIEVNKEWNHHLVFGLVPLENASINPSEYLDEAESYVIKTNRSFLNMIVSGITCGLYTPTQTKFYLPFELLNEAQLAAYIKEQERLQYNSTVRY